MGDTSYRDKALKGLRLSPGIVQFLTKIFDDPGTIASLNPCEVNVKGGLTNAVINLAEETILFNANKSMLITWNSGTDRESLDILDPGGLVFLRFNKNKTPETIIHITDDVEDLCKALLVVMDRATMKVKVPEDGLYQDLLRVIRAHPEEAPLYASHPVLGAECLKIIEGAS
jgi:hypothetical protein